MNKTNDGGPAFPVEFSPKDGWSDGMSLRDYFAAKAMQGMMSQPETDQPGTLDDLAEISYNMANAMLKSRGEQ